LRKTAAAESAASNWGTEIENEYNQVQGNTSSYLVPETTRIGQYIHYSHHTQRTHLTTIECISGAPVHNQRLHILVLLTEFTLGYSLQIRPIPWLSSSLHRLFRSCLHLAQAEALISPYKQLVILIQLIH